MYSVKKGALRNFAKFTGKHLCQTLFFKKATLLKKETLLQVFSCAFCKISKDALLTEDLRVTASESTTFEISRQLLQPNEKLLIGQYQRLVQDLWEHLIWNSL